MEVHERDLNASYVPSIPCLALLSRASERRAMRHYKLWASKVTSVDSGSLRLGEMRVSERLHLSGASDIPPCMQVWCRELDYCRCASHSLYNLTLLWRHHDGTHIDRGGDELPLLIRSESRPSSTSVLLSISTGNYERVLPCAFRHVREDISAVSDYYCYRFYSAILLARWLRVCISGGRVCLGVQHATAGWDQHQYSS